MNVEQLIKQYSKKEYQYLMHDDHDVSEINKRSAKWVFDHELARGNTYKKYLKINTGLCAYFTYPSGGLNSLDIIQLGSDLISWLFLFDDEHGEGRVHVGENTFLEKSELKEKLKSYREVISNGDLPENASPFHVSILEFVERARALSPDVEWSKRFADAMSAYFDGCIEEYDYRRGWKELDLNSYFNLRSKSIGVYPVFELITLYQDSNPFYNGDKFNLTLLEKYRYHAALLCSWVNDIFSLEKELGEEEANNLVMLLHDTFNLENYEQARNKAYEFNQKDLNKLEDILFVLQTTGEFNPSLEKYLYRLRHWAIGNLYWTICSGRYEIKLEDIGNLPQLFNNLTIPIEVQEVIRKSTFLKSSHDLN